MGKKSVKENKNIYFTSREEAGLTRAQASELIGTISDTFRMISRVSQFPRLFNIDMSKRINTAKNLSKKLLSLSLDEIEKGAKSEIPLSYNDISLLIDERKKSIAISSKNNSVQDKCEELKKSYKNIFELREKEDYNSKNYTQEVNKSRELLNEIMR